MSLGQLAGQVKSHCLHRRQDLRGLRVARHSCCTRKGTQQAAKAIAEAEALELAYRSEPSVARVSVVRSPGP